ncbi:MAG: MotA/TolQ/ExbB proton channel family protein [Leptospiraceae bacterium]|nr:MotA/TolQ/ExbB proton channel family protein [Leptospiraceae bacterium]
MSLSNLFHQGGFMMWPLLACLLLAVIVFLDRTVFLLSSYISFEGFRDWLAANWDIARPTALNPSNWLDRLLPAHKYRKAQSPLILLIGGVEFTYQNRLQRSGVERRGMQAASRMQRRMGILRMIAMLAPLLGLLGTVVGMIDSFREIARPDAGVDIMRLADGIWVALITTAFGLVVAILAQIGHAALHAVVNDRLEQMNVTVKLLEEAHLLPDVPMESRDSVRELHPNATPEPASYVNSNRVQRNGDHVPHPTGEEDSAEGASKNHSGVQTGTGETYALRS